jgi:uncharacterized protein with beta-barrel porin domain
MKMLRAVSFASVEWDGSSASPGRLSCSSLRPQNMLWRLLWLCFATLALRASPATAQNINTIGAWDGVSNVTPWDTTITETIGQTITPTSGQTKMSSFAFEVGETSGTTPMEFQAFVYQWNNGTRSISGPALFTSAVMTAPASLSYQLVSINTGSLALTSGVQYVLFFTTTSVTQASNAEYQFGHAPDSAYPAGTIVYSGSGQFSDLSSNPWGEAGVTLAFTALFNSSSLFIPLLPPGAPINPTNVAAGLDKFTNAGGTLPTGFLNLLSLTPNTLVASLSQLSGENNTDAQQGAFELMNSYLSLLTDPFATDRVSNGGALGFAPEQPITRGAGLPNAIVSGSSAPPKTFAVLDQPHWESWGAAFGGSSTNRGDATVVGSHDSTSNVGGLAAGADYRFSRDTLAGFSLAGGTTSWNLAGGLGAGSSDALLVGVYGSHKFGAAYVSGALTYANYRMSTSREVTVAGSDSLQANFNAQNFGSRLESGYRMPAQWSVDITPFAALQLQTFHTPGYGEIATNASSNQFALNYDARNATDVRTELGARADKVWQLANADSLELFGKAAWAHDAVSDPQLSASFIGLTPVASFAVNGAAPAHNLALLTGGAEWRLASGLSVRAKLDGELSDRTVTYAGTGQLRFAW